MSTRMYVHLGNRLYWNFRIEQYCSSGSWGHGERTLYGLLCRKRKLGLERHRGFLFTQNHPMGPRHPSKLGRSCETHSSHLSHGWPWMEHTPAYAQQQAYAWTYLCVHAQTCVCLGIIFCRHRYIQTPRDFCAFAHTTQPYTDICVLIVSSFEGMLTFGSSPIPIFSPVPGLSLLWHL